MFAVPSLAQTSGTNTQQSSQAETGEQTTEDKPKEPTQAEKDQALLLSNLLGGWVRLGRNGSPISNDNALAAANKCVAGSQSSTAPAAGDVVYFNNGNTLQRLETATGSTAIVQNTRLVRSRGENRLWALQTGRNTGRMVAFRKSQSRVGELTLMLEDNIIYMGCVSLMRLRQ